MEKQPNPEEVKMIFKYTYYFYDEYINQQDIDWVQFQKHYKAISAKYPFDLTLSILKDLINIISKQKGGA